MTKPHPLTPAALGTLLVLLFVAAAARFYAPGTVEFKHDEATLSLLALDWLAGGPFPLTGMPSSVGVPNAPASVYVIALPYALGGDALAATLFVTGLNVAGVGLLWLIAYRYFGFIPALVAGLAYALNPWALLYSRKIWAQDFHTPFVLLALLCGLYGFLEGRRWAQILCLPLLLFALQIHFAAWALLPLYLWLLLTGWRRVAWWAVGLSVLLGGLVLLPFAGGIAQTLEQEPNRVSGLLDRGGFTLSPDALIYTAALATGSGVEQEVAPGYAAPSEIGLIGLGAAALLGLLAVWRYSWRRAGFVWLWAGLPLLAFSVQWTAVYPHYFIASLPVYALLIGLGAGVIVPRSPLRRAAALVIVTGLALLIGTQGLYWRDLLAHVDVTAPPGGFGPPLERLLAARDDLATERDVIVLTDGIEMQYDQEPVIWSVLLHDTADCVRALAGDGKAVFPAGPFAVLAAPNAPPNPLNDLYTSAAAAVYPLRPGEGAYTVARFETPPLWIAPVMTTITPVRFDNGAELTGYHLEPDTVYLEWHLPGPVEPNYQFFVHLLDTNAERIGQRDDRFWPGRYWCAGDRLLVWTGVTVPAEARTLRVGLYVLRPDGGFTNAQVLDVNGGPVGVWVDVPLDSAARTR